MTRFRFGWFSAMLIYLHQFIQTIEKSVTAWNHDSILNGTTTTLRQHSMGVFESIGVIDCMQSSDVFFVHNIELGDVKRHSLMCLSHWVAINYERFDCKKENWCQTTHKQMKRPEIEVRQMRIEMKPRSEHIIQNGIVNLMSARRIAIYILCLPSFFMVLSIVSHITL